MADMLRETLQSVRSSLIKSYVQPEYVKSHVDNLLRVHPSFTPRMHPFTHPDGNSSHSLCLMGSLPIVYRSSTYFVPLDVWVPPSYPFAAPYVYVKPTAAMVLAQSLNVNANGRVQNEYLNKWDCNKSNLVHLLESLQAMFSISPPVYAKTGGNVSLMNSQVPRDLQPAIDPTAMRKNQLRAAVCKKFESLFAPQASELYMEVNDLLAENSRLIEDHAKICERFQKMDELRLRLEDSKRNVDDAISRCKLQIDHLQTTKPPLDNIVIASSPVHEQLSQSIAKDNAIKDTLFLLSDALKDKKIDLASYVREVRTLAKEQFFCRATVKLCSLKLNE